MCSILLVLETSTFALLSSRTTAARPATFLSPSKTEPAPKTLAKHTHSKQWVQRRKIEHQNSIGRTRPFAHVHAGTRNEEQKSRKFISTPFPKNYPTSSNCFGTSFWSSLKPCITAVGCAWPSPRKSNTWDLFTGTLAVGWNHKAVT